MRDDVHGWVVVGVDGSEHSRRALEWARQEAALRHVGCVVLHAWHYGGLDANPYFGMAVPEAEAAAHDLLEQELAIGGRREIPLVGRVVESDPADALIEASDGAALLVVGTRGRGGLTAAILGSVSTACIRGATCPVFVVPCSPARNKAGLSDRVPA
jgi:nucleotide-binding universal stress UspA family protein